MGTSALPDLIDAIHDTLETTAAAAIAGDPLFETKVFDGPQLDTGDQDSLQVGVADPDSADWVTAGTSNESPGPFATSRPRDETGEIYLTAESWNGDEGETGIKTARDRVYAIAGAVATQGRTDPKWGIQRVLVTGYGTTSVLQQTQDDNGVRASLTFRVSFRARI